MDRFSAFRLVDLLYALRNRQRRLTFILLRLISLAAVVFFLIPLGEAQELRTVEDAMPDFTKMSIENLVQQDMTVREQLEETRRLTLQEGIFGGHVHEAGEWMVGYNFKFVNMDGNRSGSNRNSTADVFAKGFMVSPTRMTMEMQSVNLMHAPSDEFTWMVMVPYKRLKMDHVTVKGTPFTTQSEGIGDVRLTGLYTFYRSERKVSSRQAELDSEGISAKIDNWNRNWEELRQAYFGLSLHIPTGSINQRDATPANPNAKLPYPMQLGSGTYDLEPSFVFQSISENWALGFRAAVVIRLGENSNDYTLGDVFTSSIWASHKLSDRISLDMRLDGTIWGDIDGADPDLNPAIVPTARSDLRGGDRLDFLLGASYYMPEGKFEGNRLHVEFGVPLHQSLNGPQLETDWLLQASWSWTY